MSQGTWGAPEGDQPGRDRGREPGDPGTTPYPQYSPYAPPTGYGYPAAAGPPGVPPGWGSPDAPFGRHPVTGAPYSDKQKLVAGLLQILVPMGIGRFYSGHTGQGVAQLLVTLLTCGVGAIWPFIDGIVILAGSPTDDVGRPLR